MLTELLPDRVGRADIAGSPRPRTDGGIVQESPWMPALAAVAVAVLAPAVTGALFVADVVGGLVFGGGLLVGGLAAVVAAYFLVQAIQTELSVMRADVRQGFEGIDLEPESDNPLEIQREFLDRIRRQQHLTRELLHELPDQQSDLQNLATELERRNRIVSAVLEEDFEPNHQADTGTDQEEEPTAEAESTPADDDSEADADSAESEAEASDSGTESTEQAEDAEDSEPTSEESDGESTDAEAEEPSTEATADGGDDRDATENAGSPFPSEPLSSATSQTGGGDEHADSG